MYKSYSEDTGNRQSFERFVQVSKRYDSSVMRELGQKHMRVQGVDCLPRIGSEYGVPQRQEFRDKQHSMKQHLMPQ